MAWNALTPAEQSDPWFERQLAALPESFVARRPAAAIADTLRRLRRSQPRAGVAWASYLPETDMIEFIAGVDQGAGRAIFSSMAGALTSNKMQILAAETNHAGRRAAADALRGPCARRAGRAVGRASGGDQPRLVASIDSNEPPTFPKIRGREQKEAGAVLS